MTKRGQVRCYPITKPQGGLRDVCEYATLTDPEPMLVSPHMAQSISVLSKRTKQEILDEFEKVQEQLEDLRSTAHAVHSQPAVDLIEKTKTKTPQAMDKTLGDFQASLQAHIMEMRASLLDQAATLQDVQRAIDVSRQQLELQRHITVAADALDLLVEEHSKKSAAFETDMGEKKRALDEQMTARKKQWEREAEEYEYQKKLQQERDQTVVAEREKALLAREATIQAQEKEVAQMKMAIEQFPHELEQSKEKREEEVTSKLSQQFSHEKALLEKETSAHVRLLELTVKNLEERLSAQHQELVSLKQQTEDANAKAQALAIKAIERPTTIVAPSNIPSTNPSSYHDRGQGRSNG